VETTFPVCVHTDQLVEAARRAHAALDPWDPVRERLSPLAEDGDPSAHVRRAGPLIAHLAGWPAPGTRPGARDGVAAGHLGVDAREWGREILGWLAAMTALQAVEAGPGSEVGRTLAAGAVALWRGDRDGLSWLAAGIRLSRPGLVD
jgi:hypothetical protein